jgi:hypothetical protein
MPMAQNERPDYTARPGEAVRVFRNDDGSFAVGVGRVRVAAEGENMAFVAAVIEVLGAMAHSSVGQEALRRGDQLNAAVLIVKPSPPTRPTNGWTKPDDVAAASLPGLAVKLPDGRTLRGTGIGCGSTIAFDPGDWGDGVAPAGPNRVNVLLTMLEQANANAAGKSNPLLPDWGVPLRS